MAYATTTTVPVERTQAEIQSTLRKFGATSFAFGEERDRGIVAFVMANRQIRMVLPLPTKLETKHWWSSGEQYHGRKRTQQQAEAALEQDRKARWRAFLLVIRAKLEAVDSGIETIDQAFLPYVALPNGQTIGEHVIPQVEEAALSGRMPTALLAIEAAK